MRNKRQIALRNRMLATYRCYSYTNPFSISKNATILRSIKVVSCIVHRVPEKKQATLIFDITSLTVEIFLQFLKHLVQD